MQDDLTRCGGAGCPLRDDCLRHRLRAEGRFNAFGRPPYDALAPGGGACAEHRPLPAPDEREVRVRAYALWEAEGRPEGRAEAHWSSARAAAAAALEAAYWPRTLARSLPA